MTPAQIKTVVDRYRDDLVREQHEEIETRARKVALQQAIDEAKARARAAAEDWTTANLTFRQARNFKRGVFDDSMREAAKVASTGEVHTGIYEQEFLHGIGLCINEILPHLRSQ